jgi:hypothetical protein
MLEIARLYRPARKSVTGRKTTAPVMTTATATQPITGLRMALITIFLSNTIQRLIPQNAVNEADAAARSGGRPSD